MSDSGPAAAALAKVRELPQRLDAQPGFVEAVNALARGEDVTWDGVWGSSCALLAAALARHLTGVLVIVCPQQDDVQGFGDDWTVFSTTPAAHFPAWETSPGERLLQDEVYGDRLRVLKQLLDTPSADASTASGAGAATPAEPTLIITSIQSLLQPTPSRDRLAESSRRLRVGSRCELPELLQWLVEGGFHGSPAVELPGEFAHRGGLLDIFAPDWYQPIRLEFFGDELESIRRFDVASQRSLESLETLEVTLPRANSQERGHFSDYLPPHSTCLLIEPERIQEEAKRYLERQERPGDCHALPDVLRELGRFPRATAAGLASGHTGLAQHLHIESVERFSGEIDRVRSELDRIGDRQEVFIVVQTTAELERLGEILRSTRLAATGNLHFPLGCLRQGFRLADPSVGLTVRLPVQDAESPAAERPRGTIVITAGELFCRGELRRLPRRRLGKAIDSFLDLREGDLVVHLAHGIGRYRGLHLLDKQGHIEEHLQLEFDGGTKIYVPASKIGLVQKYVGGSKTRPTLAKIGGKTWVRQKQAAESAVVDLAAELLEVQAARAARPGIAFVTDSDWQREFDASFPYAETPDQLLALTAIRQDMQAARPMDRLLCGDVGFGKTEVAMRAAFKAVDNGYQVAVLAPTTVLVEQHFHTFRDRLAEFPFDIGKLSRFGTAQDHRHVLRGLESGQIDVVIGTHRLASRDVQFHNLGLLIIDEEQRFGVEVKERLKSLRATVDVLTLTATPIPRTLHMSLVGLRDISNLETPPEDRLAVETRVTRFNHELIRHAVLRELSRGGQIYFVHNRVADIRFVEQQLKQIVPEARIRVGHGQMPEDELEDVMVAFVAGKFDLLLATTIVESGLDIPNANTIFINEADRYGLADLHQLRGRVGRWKHRAYCYLLLDPHQHLTPNAARRLRAIEEFSELGAGFALAMRDLEIRGAGNLLGTQQSGHIAAVGYELYCELLENAVRRLKQMPPKLAIDVDVDLPGESYLPDDYVPDLRLKIDLYRRLARISSVDHLAEFLAELNDRFGPPPAPVLRMLSLEELKIDATVWQIAEIFRKDRYLVFRYTDRRRAEQLARANAGKLRVVDEHYAYLTIPHGVTDSGELLKTVKSVLQPR